MSKSNVTLATLIAATTATLSGCAIGPNYQKPAPIASAAQTQWQTPAPVLPHDGKTANLNNWWADWNDPVLLSLIERAQAENSNVAVARARIAQSRASYAQITSNLFPNFNARGSDVRSRGQQQGGQGQQQGFSNDTNDRSRSIGLDAAWELDVVGGARRGRAAATERVASREATWHDARVSIAAEVATQYVNLRACEVLLQGYEIDSQSRNETARLTRLKEKAGFEAPANAALADASAAEARARLAQQQTDCNVLVQVLAELTVRPSQELVKTLDTKRATLPQPKQFMIDRVPASAVSQRPDVSAAEHDLIAASNDIGLAMADRFPRISLTGSIGYQRASFGGFESNGRTWSWGPQMSLPIFDAGKRAAAVDEARASYDAALATYQGATLRAVREVEESLLRINSAVAREKDANDALAGYQAFQRAADARVKAGGGSLPELEEARRAAVQAQGVAVGVSRERLLAWVSLYKSVGGGWKESQTNTTTATNEPKNTTVTP
jgi:outer membrane protein, multidrug efflux system